MRAAQNKQWQDHQQGCSVDTQFHQGGQGMSTAVRLVEESVSV